MASSKLLWLPLYAENFQSATMDWEPDEVGAYLRLLLHQWARGSLPSDHRRLARIVGVPRDEFDALWRTVGEKFRKDEHGGLVNRRLADERAKAEGIASRRTEAARKAAAARHESHNETQCVTHNETQCVTHTQSQSQLQDTDRGTKNAHAERFKAFWEVYPRKVGKRQSETAFTSALSRDIPEPDALAEIIRSQAATWTEPKFIPYPATWLNRDGWLDQVTPPDVGGMPSCPEATSSGAERLARLIHMAAKDAEAKGFDTSAIKSAGDPDSLLTTYKQTTGVDFYGPDGVIQT